ncbi:ATP-binding protein, partial [Acinetobacter baumannii]
NFFIGKNNSGKSRFLRNLFISDYPSNFFRHIEILKNIKRLKNFMLINDFSQHREKLIEMKGYYDAFFTNSKIGNFNQLIYYI